MFIMNKFLKYCLVFLIPLSMNDVALAKCEAELENAILKRAIADQKAKVVPLDVNRFRSDFIKNEKTYENYEKISIEYEFKNMEIAYQKILSESNGSVFQPATIAWYEANLCLLRDAMKKGSRDTSNTFKVQSNDQQGQQQDGKSQQAQQSQQSAQQNQARADQQRQGKRKTNDPAAQAHECVAIDQAGSGNYGAFKNTCDYKVNFSTCNYRPRTIQGGFNWSADFDCEKQQFGLHTPNGGSSVAAHNRNTEMVYWFACKAPATPVDASFVVGKGIEARCHN